MDNIINPGIEMQLPGINNAAPRESEACVPARKKPRFAALSEVLSNKKTAGISESGQLLLDIRAVESDLKCCRNAFNNVTDPAMVEACIFQMKSAESRYQFLLRKLKRIRAARK